MFALFHADLVILIPCHRFLLVSGRTVTGPPWEPNPEGQAYSEAAVSKRVRFIRCIFRFQVRDKIWCRPT